MSEVKCSTCGGVGQIEFEQRQCYAPCLTCSGSGIDWRKTCDAQRLRADTAEAERDALKTALESVELEVDTKNEEIALSDQYAKYQDERVTAAEQRIAELTDLLTGVVSDTVRWMLPGDLHQRIRAALNPEAESHE